MKNSNLITQQILSHYLMASANGSVGIAMWAAAMKFLNQHKKGNK
jgi:hypothetical protein